MSVRIHRVGCAIKSTESVSGRHAETGGGRQEPWVAVTKGSGEPQRSHLSRVCRMEGAAEPQESSRKVNPSDTFLDFWSFGICHSSEAAHERG